MATPRRLRHTRHESAEKVKENVEDVLRELSGERMLFVRDFLFSVDHSGDIAILTNQVSLANTYGETSVMQGILKQKVVLTHDTRAMYVPHFTANFPDRSLTLGVFCEQSNLTTPDTPERVSRKGTGLMRLLTGRYVLDNVTGMRLKVHEVQKDLLLSIALSRAFSTTRITAVGLSVHGKSFRDALATGDSLGMQASVVFADNIVAKRPCAICGSLPFVQCGCTFQARIPRHPFDHEAHGVQLSRLQGSFKLGASVVCKSIISEQDPSAWKMREVWRIFRQKPVAPSPPNGEVELFSPALKLPATCNILELSRDYIFSALLPQGLSAKLTEITGLARSLSLNTPTTQATSPRAPSSDSGADDVSSEWRTKILAVRRLLTAPEGTTVTNPGFVSVSKYEDQHELKMERRREKNRAAATKSNAARKERLLKLRSDLRDAKSAAESLLKKKRLLEEENEVLRDQIMASILEDLA